MKKTLLMVLVGGMLMACHSDLNLNDVDTSAEVKMGMAVPVGSVRAKLGDFLGEIPGLYVNSDGVLAVRFTFPDSRDFHKFDMRDHISSRSDTLNVYQNLDALGLIGPGGVIYGTGVKDIHATLRFDLPIKMKDINQELGKERLDSAMIEMARFSSQFGRTDLPLEWEWIDSVNLLLGDQVCREAGNKKLIYRKGDAGGYDQPPFNTDIDKFSISLMKNKNFTIEDNSYLDYEQNVIDSVVFALEFTITIPKSAGQIALLPTAKFKYNIEVEFIDYSAIWGFFTPDKDMISKKVEVNLDTILGDLTMFDRLSLPFTDPKIDVAVTTTVAGAMTLNGNYIYVVNHNGDSVFADFGDGARQLNKDITHWLHPDPRKSAIGASVTDTVHFSKDRSEGQIDRLFGEIPQKLCYDFYVNINDKKSPQARITPDTKVEINAICDLPFKFRDSLLIDYKDTIRDVNLSAVDIDSLIHASGVIDSLRTGDVTLFLTATNNIPVALKAVFCYLDKDGQPIKDPLDESKLFNPFTEDTIRIASPRFAENTSHQWVQVEDGKSVFTAHMNKDQLSVVPEVKKIAYKVIVDNEALNYAFKATPSLQEIRLTKDQTLEFQIGLTAQIDAVLNFSHLNQ